MKPCQVDWQKPVVPEILFCYREIELKNTSFWIFIFIKAELKLKLKLVIETDTTKLSNLNLCLNLKK